MTRHQAAAGILIICLALGLASAGCDDKKDDTTTGKPKSGNVNVDIKDFEFQPDSLTVTNRSRVTWTNKDAGQHTVKSDRFDSGPLGQGESFSYQFLEAGTYKYHCALHPYMEGVIIVK